MTRRRFDQINPLDLAAAALFTLGVWAIRWAMRGDDAIADAWEDS